MDNFIDIDFINEKRIMSFLRGKMTPEEETKFFMDVSNDPQLKADAINLARIAKGMKQVGEERDLMLMKAFHESNEGLLSKEELENEIFLESASYELPIVDDDNSQTNTFDNKEPNYTEEIRDSKNLFLRKASVWLLMAASLVLIVWMGVSYHSYRTTTSLGEEYCNAIYSGVIARGDTGDSEIENKLSVLFLNVQNGKNLDAAIRDLSSYWNLSTKEFYNDYTDYSAEIGWYLAIAHLKNNDKKNAKVVLEKLVASTEKDSVVNKKAKELLKRL